MTVALLTGLVAGAGLWLAAAGWRPRPAPLAVRLADLHAPHPRPDGAGTGRASSWLATVMAAAGLATRQRTEQLALAGIPAHVWARDKVLAAGAGLATGVAGWAGALAVGLPLPPAVGLAVPALAAAGWLWPDLRLADTVTRRRRAFAHALSAYLDLVNVILAGGAGIETALIAAADAGDGWAFAELRHALHRARRINQPLWTAFDELGERLGAPELRDLAATLGLAGSQGARIRASLAVKADTLRAHQIAQTEAAAEATTERMNLPTAVLLAGFLLFIVFPAVKAITQVSTAGCATPPATANGPAACQPATPVPADTRSHP